MAQEVQYPSETERKAFMEKLGQFRGTLNDKEQRLLDGMVIQAFQPEKEGDVQGYIWLWNGYGYVWQPTTPAWYYTAPVYYAPYWGPRFYP
jgi:hypothetical protein